VTGERDFKPVLLKKSRDKGMGLSSGKDRKIFVCFLCLCFFFWAGGFPGFAGRMVQAKETSGLSIGEMISRGEVKFEVREKVWKAVDPLHFPVFKGMKVKTEKGVAALILGSNTQVELGEQSILAVDQADRIILLQGRIDFRIPSGVEASFRVGTLSVTKSRSLQASKGSVTVPGNVETIGSITLHGNGAATVKSHQGNVSIAKQGQVLAALSSNDMMTIPSVTVSGEKNTRAAQAGASDSSPTGSVTREPVPSGPKVEEEPAGAATRDDALLLWVPLGGIAAGGAIVIGRGGDHKTSPRCR